MAYDVDYSPLSWGTSTAPLGGKIGEMIGGAIERGKTERKQKVIGDLSQRALGGEVEAQTELAARYPEANTRVMEQIGAMDERTQKGAAYDFANVLSMHQAGDIEGAKNYFRQRIESINNRGGDSSQSQEMLARYEANPDQGAQVMYGLLQSMNDPEGFAAGGAKGATVGATPDIKNYEYAKGQGFAGSLLDFQALGKDPDSRTTAIKEFEYGEKNPKFNLRNANKKDTVASAEAARKSFKDSSDLRKEFLSQSSEYQKVRDAYTRVVGSTDDPSPAGDLSLIFNYMKMLDPGSVVRESEFATAAAAGSYGERTKAMVQKVVSGERLSPSMRKDFISKSAVLYKGMQDQHTKRSGNYRKIATDNNFNPDEVVIDITAPQQEPPQGVTEDDIIATMQANNMTREQVMQRLAGQ